MLRVEIITKDDITAVDADSYTSLTAADLTGLDGTGKDQHFFTKGLNVELVSASKPDKTGYPDNDGASSTWKYDAEIVLNVSAFGSDMYLIYAQPASAAMTAASAGIKMNVAESGSSSISYAVSNTSGATEADYGWKIGSEPETFTVTGVVESTVSDKDTCWWSYLYIDNLRWMDADTEEDGELFDWGLDTFKTSSIQLCPKNK